LIQVPPFGAPALGDQADQRAFAGLAGTGDHHAGVGERFGNGRFGVPGQQPAERARLDAYHLIRVP
jgi:hypothetical protein